MNRKGKAKLPHQTVHEKPIVASLLLVEVKLEMFKAPHAHWYGRGLLNFASHHTWSTPSERLGINHWNKQIHFQKCASQLRWPGKPTSDIGIQEFRPLK